MRQSNSTYNTRPYQVLKEFALEAVSAAPQSEAEVVGILKPVVVVALKDLITTKGLSFIPPMVEKPVAVLEMKTKHRAVRAKLIWGDEKPREVQQINITHRRKGFLGITHLYMQDILSGSLYRSYAMDDTETYVPYFVSEEAVAHFDNMGDKIHRGFGSMHQETGHAKAQRAREERPQVLQGFLRITSQLTQDLVKYTS